MWGRDAELHITRDVVVSLPRAQGKTQLVLNYVDRHATLYDLCVWIGVDTLQESCLAAAAELGVKTGAARAVVELGAHLANCSGTKLVVLDNADTVRWAELAPLAETGHVVVTTRNRALLEMASQGGQVELSTLSEPQALELLGVDASVVGAVDLVRALGCLPLPLAHARASIARHEKTPAELLVSLRTAEAGGGNDLARVYSHETLALLDLSVRNASDACAERGVPGDAARRLAVACGYMHAESMPRWFLERWLDIEFNMVGAAADMVLEQLVQFSVLSLRGGSEGLAGFVEYDMHRILQAAIRARDRDCVELGALLQCLQHSFEYNANDAVHPRTEALAAHAQCVCDHSVVLRDRLREMDRAWLTNVLHELGRWWKFRGLNKRVRPCVIAGQRFDVAGGFAVSQCVVNPS